MNPWLLIALLTSCKTQSSNVSDSAGLDWLKSPSGAYSWAFTATPPEGRFIKLAVWQADSTSACEKQKAGMQGKLDGFWVLLLTLGEATAGQYEIQPTMDPHAGGQLAKAELVFVEKGQRKIVLPAQSGSINVASLASTLPEWKDGQEMRLDAHLVLATTVYRQLECVGGQSPGGVAVTECTCEDQHTQETRTCTIDDGQVDCCSEFASGSNPVQFSVVAQTCPEMCIYSDPSLGGHCMELGG